MSEYIQENLISTMNVEEIYDFVLNTYTTRVVPNRIVNKPNVDFINAPA